MKILFSSHFFPPSVGGIEEVGGILASEFARRGHEVIVVTQTIEEAEFPFQSFQVKRGVGMGELVRLTRWSDVVFHNNVSLRTAWPLAVIRRPWVVAHHTWIARVDGRRALVDKVKLRAIKGARNVAVSGAIAAKLGVEARVIPNPYRDDVFRRTNEGAREGDVVFLGRLVSDKGVDILIGALGVLKERGIRLRTTIVGDGPEMGRLKVLAEELEVSFVGVKRDGELVEVLNRHKVMVVPSRWEEPFGLVALEGMACGCVPVAAGVGGLPEVVGEAGVVFSGGDCSKLASSIEKLVCDPAELEKLREKAAAHLERFRAERIAGDLQVLEEAVG